MIKLILWIPFAIELAYDRLMLPESEIRWYSRANIIIFFSVVFIAFSDYAFVDWGWYLFDIFTLSMFACAPYCFFDIALAVWLHGWRKWYRLGDTKRWDRFLSSLNPWFLLVLRVVAFVELLWVGL